MGKRINQGIGMIKTSRRRKFDRCPNPCQGKSLGNYCVRCDASVCINCAIAHIAAHRKADAIEIKRLRELSKKLEPINPADTPYDPRVFTNLAAKLS
jgi:hypothetical protein